MNIVILAGGTGSIALQTGLYEYLKLDGINTKVIVNAYDNGLSTGAVRKVMDGKILGPSDVRKNQTTRLTLENPRSHWLPFLNIRFTAESSKAREYCHDQVMQLETKMEDSIPALRAAINAYFSVPVAEKIDYTDFSLANIIYAGLARMRGNSLRKAASTMSALMGIEDNVLLNDDKSMFLGAITKSGKRITDEGDIVSWGNVDDPFVDVFFTDQQGYDTEEAGTNPILCEEAQTAIAYADLIILSSGTLWSSLIPTYASRGFARAIESNCKAKVLMVMNRQPDKDSPGQTADEILNILVPKYFEPGRLHVIADTTGHPQMNTISDDTRSLLGSFLCFNMGYPVNGADVKSVHFPPKLARAIGFSYFHEYLDSDYYMFDYDDTLVGRGNKFPISSKANAQGILHLNNMEWDQKGNLRFKVGICTGNTVKSVALRHPSYQGSTQAGHKALTIFADGGANKYSYDTSPASTGSDDGISCKLIECVNKDMVIHPDLVDDVLHNLREAGIPLSKIDNRGGVLLAIKPIDPEYRSMVTYIARHVISDRVTTRGVLVVREAGRTTVEICKPELSKIDAINHVIDHENPKSITYVGDELDSGNDAAVEKLSHDTPLLKCLRVNDPVETAFFILTLQEHATHAHK